MQNFSNWNEYVNLEIVEPEDSKNCSNRGDREPVASSADMPATELR